MTDPAISQFLHENSREILEALKDDLVRLAGDKDFNEFQETEKIKFGVLIKKLDESTQQLINTITKFANTLNNTNIGKWRLSKKDDLKIIQVTEDDGNENVDHIVGGNNNNCNQISQFLVYKIVKGLFGALINKSFITVWNIIATILGIIFRAISLLKWEGCEIDDAKNLRIFLQNIDKQYWDEIDKGIEQLKDKKCSYMFIQKFSNLITTIHTVKKSIKKKFPKKWYNGGTIYKKKKQKNTKRVHYQKKHKIVKKQTMKKKVRTKHRNNA